MLAYANIFSCTQLALIYPWYPELEGSQETVLLLPGKNGDVSSVTIVCVNLDTLEMQRGQSSMEFGCPMPTEQPHIVAA
jgi:5-methylcytosine-specific restriction endonuclease McrBC regulatory subunit McrC